MPTYEKGKKIETLVEFSSRLQDRKPFYWRHKFLAAGFIEHWSIIMILRSIKCGVLRTAIKLPTPTGRIIMGKKFDSDRKGTGTQEWAEVNENICRGCPNDCLYCYAAANAKRFNQRDRENWHVEEFTKRSKMTSYPAKDGVIMFPSAHDITPFNVDEYIRVATLILEKGNRLLIVSKPRIECVAKLVGFLCEYTDQILFRFTIGTMANKISKFWEPGAPFPVERVRCLEIARDAGYKTSVSIEPMLAGADGAEDVIASVSPFVTETIWVGKMNRTKLRVDMTIPANVEAVANIDELQSDKEIMALYNRQKNNPMIRWKDSIKTVIAK